MFRLHRKYRGHRVVVLSSLLLGPILTPLCLLPIGLPVTAAVAWAKPRIRQAPNTNKLKHQQKVRSSNAAALKSNTFTGRRASAKVTPLYNLNLPIVKVVSTEQMSLAQVSPLIGPNGKPPSDTDIENALNDPRVKVEIANLPTGKVAVLLTGVLHKKEEIRATEKLVALLVPETIGQIVSSLYADADAPTLEEARKPAPAPTPPPVPKKTDIWPLSFVSSRVTPLSGATVPASTNTVDKIVVNLNNIYSPGGENDTKNAIQRMGSSLLLYHTPDKILEIKRILALIDVPYPQVRMQMWVVQASGKRDQVNARMRLAAAQISDAQLAVRSITREHLFQVTNAAFGKPQDLENEVVLKRLRDKYKIKNLENPRRPISLNQSLIFIALSRNRASIYSKFCHRVQQDPALASMRLRAMDYGAEVMFPRLASLCGAKAARLDGLLNTKKAPDATDSQISLESDQQGVMDFLDAVELFTTYRDVSTPQGLKAPQELARASARTDRLMEALMIAFSLDIKDLLFTPLLYELQGIKRDKDVRTQPVEPAVSGVTLVGNTEMVVTSGQDVMFDPEMQSFVQNNVPRPLDVEFLKSVLGDSGLATLLPKLSNPQAALLAAALSQPQPTYSTVAPGVGVHILPKVLADSASARLQIDFCFGVETTPQAANTDSWALPPADTIKSHRGYTNVNVDAFDLFSLSSFSLQSSHPQSPDYVPILGRLPLIGNAFQFPRGPKKVEHESIILVNSVIVPRAVDLVRFYGDVP